MATRYVGQPITRREDVRLITGRGKFIDDATPAHSLHLVFVRSPLAHARIRRIDASRARAAPDVVAVLTGADFSGLAAPAAVVPNMRAPERPLIAIDRVAFMGDPVAAILAFDRYAAADAAELLDVDYDALPSVSDQERALEPDSPLVHEELGSNAAFELQRGSAGVDEALTSSDIVAHVRVKTQRVSAVPIETRGVVAEYDPFVGGLTLWLPSQMPHAARSGLARLLGLPESKVRVQVQDIGGAFGTKSGIDPEALVAAHLAWTRRCTVTWIETRGESLRAMAQGRAHVLTAALGVQRDGRLVALDVQVISDIGAVLHPVAAGPLNNIVTMASGPYRIPSARSRATAVYTNRTSVAPYRGAGRPEAVFILERAVDEAARLVGLDPAELRRRNLLPADAFPYATPTGLTYDSGNYALAFEKALELADYEEWRRKQQQARAQKRYLGIGICTFVEPAGSLLWEYGSVRVDAGGNVTLLTGSSPHGQGHQTTFAQIVADELGVGMDDVTVIHGDTAVVATGGGSFGSRSAALGGSAALGAARTVTDKMRAVAANLMEAPADELVLEEGQFHVLGAPSPRVSFVEVAQAAHAGRGLGQDMAPGLEAQETFRATDMQFPFGTHVAVVEVLPQSGEVQVLRYVGVDDCGSVINPLLVEGQVLGGIVQGLGQALQEEVVYDEDNRLQTTSLMEYAVPKAAQVPHIDLDHTETPSPLNPLGAKGVGEAGAIASPSAILNAVLDALQPLGITQLDFPLTPPKIWAAIRAAETPA